MLEVVLIVLLVMLLFERKPGWHPADPVGLVLSLLLVIFLIVLILKLIGGVGGLYSWRW